MSDRLLTYLAPSIVGIVMLVVAGSASAISTAPAGTAVAAVFPPWWNKDEIFAAAASTKASIVRTGRMGVVILIDSEGDDLVERMYGAGAMAVVDPIMAGGCFN